MFNKFRLRLLKKLAQTNVPANTVTDSVAATTPVSGSPPVFSASGYYPTINLGFQAKNVPIINGLANILNTALYYTSNGQVSLPWMRGVNFNFSSDQSPSVDLKNIMNFSKLVYNQLFTNLGDNYRQQLTPEQIAEKIQVLKSSAPLNNLSPNIQNTQLSSKIGGNLKTIINNYLLQIK